MAEIIRMPRLSDTMEEGIIVGWQKKVGDSVGPGDILAEVETDKATMELESFQEGVLLHIGIPEGSVPVDGVIAIIGSKGEDISSLLEEIEKENSAPKESPAEAVVEVVKAAPASPVVNTPAAPAVSHQMAVSNSDSNGRVKASPLAKKMASVAGIDLNMLSGTGEDGRIIKKDIESFISSGGSMPAQMQSPIAAQVPAVNYGDHPISQMRKIIAKRLGESKFNAPHFYLTVEINMDNAITARKAMNAIEGVKISFNDLVVKASASALKKHPWVNASWLGDKMTVHPHVNIGVAVAVEEGLVVPVIHNCDLKSLSVINAEVKTLAGKARSKKIQPQEMSGNTFTISNLGMFGIEEFTGIINPPDACILAVGAIIQKPIVKDGAIVPASMMKVTLSCDHRIVDGAKGAEFLNTLKSYLEDPVRMLV